ncbi:MAG: hypothetical protein WDN26_13125 [Chitinophagaceae bacterium]
MCSKGSCLFAVTSAFKLNYYWLSFCGVVTSSTLQHMKIVGILLIVAGITMLIIRGFSVQTEKKVVDIGPVEINKKENKWFTWPVYSGAIAIVAGIVVVVASQKKRD